MPRHHRQSQPLSKSPTPSTTPSIKAPRPLTGNNPATIARRLQHKNPVITPQEINVLQRTLGNAAVAKLLQPKLGKQPTSASATTPPIQRISEKDAEMIVGKWFDPDVAIQVWSLMLQRLENAEMELYHLSSMGFYEFIQSMHSKLKELFPKWRNQHKLDTLEDNEVTDQFLDFVWTLANDDSGENQYAEELLYGEMKTVEWQGGEEDDLDYKEEEVDESEYKLNKGDFVDPVPQITPNFIIEEPEKVKVKETGERAEQWYQQKQEAIKNITTSDKGKYDVISMEEILKNRPELIREEDNRHMQVKGEKKKTGEKKKKEYTMRPDNAGPATIILEEFIDPYTKNKESRTVFIEAEVVPGGTSGRLQAPEPENKFQVSTGQNIKKKDRSEIVPDVYRNSGVIDAHKGHIIALELGGPDVPKNIVPQWASWQANGLWRKMETFVLKAAEKQGCLKMRVQVHYKESSDNKSATFRGLAFPNLFTVTVWEIDPKTKAQKAGFFYEKTLETGQDHTDDKIMFRNDDKQMTKMGQTSSYSIEDLKGKKGEKKSSTDAPKKKRVVKKKSTTDTPKKKIVKKKNTTTFPKNKEIVKGKSTPKSFSGISFVDMSDDSEDESEKKKKTKISVNKNVGKLTPPKKTIGKPNSFIISDDDENSNLDPKATKKGSSNRKRSPSPTRNTSSKKTRTKKSDSEDDN